MARILFPDVIESNIGDGNQPKDTIALKLIEIDKIVVPTRIRQEASVSEPLLYSIRKYGLLEPIKVTPASNGEEYILVHGLQRLLAFMELNMPTIPAIVDTSVDVKELRLTESICNQVKPYTIEDIIEFGKYLEKQQTIFVISEIEEILGLKPGQYLKLKAVMEYGDEELISGLKNGRYTIEQAFRKMERRKKQDELNQKEPQEGKLEEGFNPDDLFKPERQEVGKRHPLPTALRKAIEARDKFTCQCCGISGMTFSKIFEVHHIRPVYMGGDDSEGNLILLCPNCHKLVHLYGFGDLYIADEDKNKEAIKNVIKLGTIIREGIIGSGKPIEYFRSMEKEYMD